ncbi:cell division protein SepF [archaeon]|nr:cell division protein SepF [archaeon]MBL7057569.1 cell division protein SepF [Candidatus Woesearchaeota archaeon]
MKNLFSFKKFTQAKHSDNVMDEDMGGEEYVEIDTEAEKERTSKIIVRPFVMEDFSDIKEVLDTIREGYTIALINIKPLKDKDLVELKRAINKLKKTCDAIDGDIAGFGDDYVVVTPSFAEIYRTKSTNNLRDE